VVRAHGGPLRRHDAQRISRNPAVFAGLISTPRPSRTPNEACCGSLKAPSLNHSAQTTSSGVYHSTRFEPARHSSPPCVTVRVRVVDLTFRERCQPAMGACAASVRGRGCRGTVLTQIPVSLGERARWQLVVRRPPDDGRLLHQMRSKWPHAVGLDDTVLRHCPMVHAPGDEEVRACRHVRARAWINLVARSDAPHAR
jgi:hypothetical protein